MHPSWLDLQSDEEVIRHSHPSIWLIYKQVLLALVVSSFLIGLILSDLGDGVEFLGMPLDFWLFLGVVLSFIPLISASIRRIFHHFVVTNKVVYNKRRILGRAVNPTPIRTIVDFNYDQNWVDKRLNKGDIRVMTAGTGDEDMKLYDVPDPKGFIRDIRDQMDGDSQVPSDELAEASTR